MVEKGLGDAFSMVEKGFGNVLVVWRMGIK